MTSETDAVAEANRAVNEAIGAAYARRQFTVSKFGRHPDGYLHARVVVNGEPFYFSRQWGSWLAPGQQSGRGALKEPEALLGGKLGREVKFELSRKSGPFDTADRKRKEEANARERNPRRTEDPGVADAPDGAD